MRINTNVSSMQAVRELSSTRKVLESSSSKLASGSRIMSASDDAAGLSLSQNLKAQSMGMKQAHRNANDAVSMFQVIDGAINEQQNIITRLRELAIQSASDTIADEQRDLTNIEYMELKDELHRISQTTEYQGRQVLNMTDTPDFKDFQIGIYNEDSSRMSVNPFDFMTDEESLGLTASSVWSKEDARTSLSEIDDALNELSTQRSIAGAYQANLTSTINNLDSSYVNTTGARSRIEDVDYASETADNIRAKLKMQTTSAVLAQANNMGANALKLLRREN